LLSKIRLKGFKDRWIFLMVFGTMVNAGSALYDKFLIQSLHTPGRRAFDRG
jgi:hypothetical protein